MDDTTFQTLMQPCHPLYKCNPNTEVRANLFQPKMLSLPSQYELKSYPNSPNPLLPHLIHSPQLNKFCVIYWSRCHYYRSDRLREDQEIFVANTIMPGINMEISRHGLNKNLIQDTTGSLCINLNNIGVWQSHGSRKKMDK